MIYKKYSHSDDSNIFLRYIWFSPTVLGLQLPNPLEFPDENNSGICYYVKEVILDSNQGWELVASRSQLGGKRIGMFSPTPDFKGWAWSLRLTHH